MREDMAGYGRVEHVEDVCDCDFFSHSGKVRVITSF